MNMFIQMEMIKNCKIEIKIICKTRIIQYSYLSYFLLRLVNNYV